jgi:hypothetical protein
VLSRYLRILDCMLPVTQLSVSSQEKALPRHVQSGEVLLREAIFFVSPLV